MNIQPGNSPVKRKLKSSAAASNDGMSEFLRLLSMALYTVVIVGVFGSLGYAYIKFDRQINEAASEINRINDEIVQIDREINTLTMQYARCSSRPFIEGQIAKFKLPLQELHQNQQQTIRLYSNAQLAKIFRQGYFANRRVAVDAANDVKRRRFMR